MFQNFEYLPLSFHKQNVGYQDWKMPVFRSSHSDQTASSEWVCAVCLGLFWQATSVACSKFSNIYCIVSKSSLVYSLAESI